MRRVFLVLVVLVALAGVPAYAQLCTEIPLTSERDIRLATYKVMSQVLVESGATPYHAERLKLAQHIAANPGEWWRVIVEYRQAQVSGCTVNWGGLTYDQLVTNVSTAWTEVAQLRYPPEIP